MFYNNENNLGIHFELSKYSFITKDIKKFFISSINFKQRPPKKPYCKIMHYSKQF